MKTWFLPLLLLLLFACSATALAQGANVLEGKVITPSGTQPNNPVRVKLTYNGRPINETFTDLSGRFSFPGLARGMYQLTAEGDGVNFETTTVYAEVSAYGAAPQNFTQDIQLRPVPHQATQPAGVVNAFTQAVPEAARQAFALAVKLEQEGKTDAAVEKMNEATKIFPDYFDAHLELGSIFLRTNQFKDAIAELDRAREINPNDERAYQTFGVLLMKQGNFAVAVAVFAEAARLNPSNPANQVMRATALIHQAAASTNDRASLLSRAETAIAQAASTSDNKSKPDSITLAMFYELKDQPDRAAAELESYLQKNPQLKNSAAIQTEIKRLRDKAQAKKSNP
jgi:tetratricopeptide (TPR) repeat protein